MAQNQDLLLLLDVIFSSKLCVLKYNTDLKQTGPDEVDFIKLKENIKVYVILRSSWPKHCVELLVVPFSEEHAAFVFRIEVRRARMRFKFTSSSQIRRHRLCYGRLPHRAQPCRDYRQECDVQLSTWILPTLVPPLWGDEGPDEPTVQSVLHYRLLFSKDESWTTVIMTTKWSSSVSADRSPIITHCAVFSYSWGAVTLSPLGTSATTGSIVPVQDERWVWSSRRNENWQWKPNFWEKTSPSTTLPTINPTWPGIESRPRRWKVDE
jgi:hypothetical protein